MQITKVNITIIKNQEHLKAIAEVILDNQFIVKDIKVVAKKEGYFVSMPSKKIERAGKVEYYDVAHSLAPGFTKEINNHILDEYYKITGEKVKKENKEE